MRLGIGIADITPDWPVAITGFAARAGATTDQVAHPIKLRVALVESDETAAAVVSAELLNWSTEDDDRFRRTLADTLGLAPAKIMFTATHSHSGPQTNHFQAASMGAVDPRYLDLLEDRLRQAGKVALADREDVILSRASASHPLASHRRPIPADYPEPLTDDELTVLTYRHGTGVKAMFVHYSCHPVVSGENRVSGDFLGYAMSELEQRTGGMALPLQGCCGDINPREAAGAGLIRAEELGHDFAAAVLAIVQGPQQSVEKSALEIEWAEAELPFAEVPAVSTLQGLTDRPGVAGEWARGMLAHPQRLIPAETLRLQKVTLGDGVGLLALSGEVTTPYGVKIKNDSGGQTLPVAYSNGMVGYIPTARQLADGGYEADDSTKYYLLSSRFSPVIEENVCRAIDHLLRP